MSGSQAMGDGVAGRTRAARRRAEAEPLEAANSPGQQPVLETNRTHLSERLGSGAVANSNETNEPRPGTSSQLDEPRASTSENLELQNLSSDVVRIPFIDKKRRKFNFERHSDRVKIGKSVYNKAYVDYMIENPNDIKDYGEFLADVEPIVKKLLESEVASKKHLKCNIVLSVDFTSQSEVHVEYAYRTNSDLIVSQFDVEQFCTDQFARILSLIDLRDLSGGSGFKLFRILNLEVRISKVKLLKGGSFIPLPKWLELKKAVINVKSGGNECFKDAIYAHHCSESNQNFIGPRMRRRLEGRYNFDGVRFPTPLADLKLFAKQNNMTINCYGLDKKQIFPIIIYKEHKKKHLDLLYLNRGLRTHYAWIKNLSRMLGSQVSKHNGKKHFCERCLMNFKSAKALTAHKTYCNAQKMAATVLPEKNTYFEFSKFDACQLAPLIIAADFESILQKHHTCQPDPKTSFTTETQSHVAVSFGACLHANIDTRHVPQLPLGYFGCANKSEKQLWRQVYNYFVRVAKAAKVFFDMEFPISMSDEDRLRHEEAQTCYVCGHEFTEANYKVLDHDHYVAENNFRGSAHNVCNLKLRKFNYVPCYFHSLSSYDLHHLMKIFCSKGLDIKVLAVTLERYITFSFRLEQTEFRFLDSYLMLNDSLKVVSESMTAAQYVETKKMFPEHLHELILRKAPFPYNFMDSAEKLDAVGFPDKSFFHCDLSDTPATDAEYARAKQIWDACECVTFGEFLHVYNKSDTAILLDALLTARELYWTHFQIDMCSFLSLAHLSMQVMLKTTGVRLELMNRDDPIAFDMVKRSLFGGITMSNVKLTDCGEEWECLFVDAIGKIEIFNFLNSLILILSCAGLYCGIMRDSLFPVGEYRRVRADLHDWRTLDPEMEFGYMLEVDITYPDGCHAALDSFPPLPERVTPPGCTGTRLLNDLRPKLHYVLNLGYLQLVLRLGGVLERIHNVLEFKQERFLKPYIEKLCLLRQQSTTKYANTLYKYLANIIAGEPKSIFVL